MQMWFILHLHRDIAHLTDDIAHFDAAALFHIRLFLQAAVGGFHAIAVIDGHDPSPHAVVLYGKHGPGTDRLDLVTLLRRKVNAVVYAPVAHCL